MLLNVVKTTSERFLILSIGILSMLSMGTVYSWSVFRYPLEQSAGLTTLQSGIPFLVFLSLYAFTMPFAGRLIERYHPAFVAVIGSVILSSGYLLAGFTNSLLFIVLTYGVLGGIGVGMVYGVPLAMALRWFPESRGVAAGITLLGFGLSPVITAPIVSVLIENYGVHSAFKILGLFFLFLLPVISLFFRNPVSYTGSFIQEYDKNTANQKARFYLLWSLFFIVAFSGLLTISITSPFSQDILNIDNSKGAIILSAMAVFNGLARPAFGYLVDRVGLKVSMVFSFLLLLISSLLIAKVTEGAIFQFLIGIAMLWTVFGGWLTMVPLSVVKLFGEKNSSKNYGKVFSAYGFGAISGVFLASQLKDITGNYQPVYFIVFSLALIGILLIYKLFNLKKI